MASSAMHMIFFFAFGPSTDAEAGGGLIQWYGPVGGIGDTENKGSSSLHEVEEH